MKIQAAKNQFWTILNGFWKIGTILWVSIPLENPKNALENALSKLEVKSSFCDIYTFAVQKPSLSSF